MKKSLMQRGFSPLIIILVIAVLAVGGVVAWRLLGANSQVNNKAQSNNSSEDNQQPQDSSQAPSSTTYVLRIKELGIKITLPQTLKGIAYSVKPSNTAGDGRLIVSAVFSTDEIAALDKDCSTDGSEPPLGDLTRSSGQYPTNPNQDNATGSLVKQFSDFYITTRSLQSVCGYPQSSELASKIEKARGDFINAYSTIQQE